MNDMRKLMEAVEDIDKAPILDTVINELVYDIAEFIADKTMEQIRVTPENVDQAQIVAQRYAQGVLARITKELKAEVDIHIQEQIANADLREAPEEWSISEGIHGFREDAFAVGYRAGHEDCKNGEDDVNWALHLWVKNRKI